MSGPMNSTSRPSASSGSVPDGRCRLNEISNFPDHWFLCASDQVFHQDLPVELPAVRFYREHGIVVDIFSS